MPELPDLQVFSRNLNKQFAGKTLKKATVFVDQKLNVSTEKLKTSLEKKKLDEVFREGKELHFKFSGGDILGLHLMLRGQLYIFEKKNEHKFSIIELLFSDDTGLALCDYQKAATLTLNPEVRKSPDALSEEVNSDFLKEKLQGTRTTIKNLLLDQHIIRGIGNAYADEILWDAHISPFSVCNKIPDAEIKKLAKSIKSVLKDAEKHILKIHPNIISGEVRDFLKIHNAKKRNSPTGGIIKIKTVSSRKTYYTDEQELFN
jgi:formamidopyrimidine-DNA glycosylase